MGRLTEAYAYLNVNPFYITDVLFELTYITITDNLREERKRLKWYKKDEKKYQLTLDLFFEID